MSFEDLLPTGWKKIVTNWLDEDTPSFDYGGYVVGNDNQTANLFVKAKGVLAGVPFFTEVFEQVDCKVEWLVKEGVELDPTKATNGKIIIAKVTGSARKILLGERPALNMLARASGIATIARQLYKLKLKNNWNGLIAATRKTTPGLVINRI